LIALIANLVVAAAKLVAGLLSGSAAMLAESAHSVADSVNEVILGLSLRRSRRPADVRHPFGHGRERFLWALIAAFATFLVGGCLSIGLAIRELAVGGPPDDTRIAWLVLVVAFVADGVSWRRGLRQARHESQEDGVAAWRYLWRTSEPTLRAVVVEDSAALLGLVLAACGLLFSDLTGSNIPDALASLLIGILLAFTAVGLARPLADYLIGRSLPSGQLQHLQALLAAAPAVQEVLTLRAVYTAPEEVVVVARIHPAAHLTIDQLTQAMDDIDRAMRKAVPEVADVYLDVTTYLLATLPVN
jgi:cation diffusion facilitator family transporter